MKTKHHIIPVLYFLIISGLFEVVYFFPRNIYVISVLMIVLNFVFVMKINSLPFFEKIKSGNFWNFWFPLVAFDAGALLFSLIMTNPQYIHLLSFVVAFFSFLYLRSLFVYFRQPLFYEEHMLPNILLSINTLSLFMLTSALHAFLFLVLNFSFVIVSVVLLFVSFLLSYQYFWTNHIPSVRSLVSACTVSLIMVQLVWALRFLPFGYIVVGLILSLIFHVFQNFIIFWIQDIWEFKLVRKYIIIGLAIFAFIFTTAQW